MNRRSSSTVDYTLFKYSDLNPSWIVCQGHLNYRCDRIRLFNRNQFELYYVVLAKVPTENRTNTMALYLYRDQTKKPTNFFQLNEYERITDQCPTPIKSKYFLFALIGKDSHDVEIFGAHNSKEGDEWMKAIANALQSTNIDQNRHVSPIIKRTHRDDRPVLDPTNADTHFAYEPFNNSQEENLREQYPRPSAPPVEFHPSFSERRPSLNIVSDGSTAYLTVDEAKPKQNAENDEIHYEQIVDEQSFTWKEIFYSNENDDHAQVLNNIGQIGTFLVRPQLKSAAAKDHQYTLSILAFGGIIKYKIFELWDKQFSLTIDDDEPDFRSIPELCLFYTNHPLPRSATKNASKKASVGNLQLKFPYKFYQQNSTKKS